MNIDTANTIIIVPGVLDVSVRASIEGNGCGYIFWLAPLQPWSMLEFFSSFHFPL
jgi:hypothetical protein